MNEEEETKTTETEKPTGTEEEGNQSEEPEILKRAHAENERLVTNLARLEEQNKRLEENIARAALGGVTEGHKEEPEKPSEDPAEYLNEALKGNLPKK